MNAPINNKNPHIISTTDDRAIAGRKSETGNMNLQVGSLNVLTTFSILTLKSLSYPWKKNNIPVTVLNSRIAIALLIKSLNIKF